MAGDRTAYEQALNAGANYAWERRWDEAIQAYRRALAEFPDDVAALAGLGLAFAEAGRLEDALDTYRHAAEVDPENPTFPERVGEVLERLGRPQEAASAYLEAAERYMRRQAPSLALERWEDAVRVDPSCVPAHVRLLRAHLAAGRKAEALREYLALAEIYHAEGKTGQAMDLCRYALRLDPHHPEVLAMMDRLRYGEREPPERPPGTGPLAAPPEEARGSPVEIAREKALADLAEVVFEETPPQTGSLILRPLSKHEMDTLLARGLDAQRRGDVKAAIPCYEEVLRGGVILPAVNFNLGLLYQQELRFEEAIEQFEQALQDSHYRLGSLFALGECQRALGRIDEAVASFLEVLKAVDLSAVGREKAEELTGLYDELARAYTTGPRREYTVEFLNYLIDFLNERGWEEKASEARKLLDAAAPEGPIITLAELLSAPEPEKVLRSLSAAQEYARRGLWNAALDELSTTLLIVPTHLVVHRQMAELLLQKGETNQAIAKFLYIANVYRVRGEHMRAAALYERILRLTPMDVTVRTRLIGLLVERGQIDQALEQYMVLGETYYQMAQWDKARETYDEALRLAPRGSPERRWAVRILHRMGDIDMQRVDWKRAIAVYERIRDLAPDDEKACVTLIDLYRRLGRHREALEELDRLVTGYRAAGEPGKAIPILRALVDENPEDIPLRTRLAQAYLDDGNIEEAVSQLDTLGDLQLQAGRVQEAVRTIQVILRLNPPNAEAYRELLGRLQSGQIP